ncbi:hypothetical protein SAMN05877838_2122 [Hoeflea halophila]|uniref:SPW repeat-containing protein n=1 Tax=Hoeflea halophila TaxID=714899 RepID=A0A286IB37_9HYPH|nr:DUF6804 family protein [Hoeflea halophila]SOE17227.1 hypothetical protein SAMN05877838_2122 [Hoeflea halophila]
MINHSRFYLLIPSALLILAVLPMPYGFYTFLRIAVTLAAVIAAYVIYQASQSLRWEVVVMGLVAILFNPVFQVSLSRTIWLPIDLLCAALFFYVAVTRPRRPAA